MASTSHNEQELPLRFLQLMQARLAEDGESVADWLWYPPAGEGLDEQDPAVLEQMDLHARPQWLQTVLNDPAALPPPDLCTEVLPWLRERFVLLRVGGLGSHLVRVRPFQELDAVNDPQAPWVFDLPYGNTMASAEECLACALDECRGLPEVLEQSKRQVLVFAHSRGANVALDLIAEPACTALGNRVRGVVAFCGAIGGSPAAEGALAQRIKGVEGAHDALRRVLERVQGFWPTFSDPLWQELPSLADLPVGLNELSPAVRQARLALMDWPAGKLLWSIGAVPAPGQMRLFERLAGRELTRRFAHLAGYDLSQHSWLNDTQVLLRDAQWPEGSGGQHLATVRSDHWGVAYGKLLPLIPPDPTPRVALYEALLTALYEALRTEEGAAGESGSVCAGQM